MQNHTQSQECALRRVRRTPMRSWMASQHRNDGRLLRACGRLRIPHFAEHAHPVAPADFCDVDGRVAAALQFRAEIRKVRYLAEIPHILAPVGLIVGHFGSVLASIRSLYPWLRRIFADGGYAGDKLRAALRAKAPGGWRSSSAQIAPRASRFAPMGRRADLRLAWPLPPPRQGFRSHHRQRPRMGARRPHPNPHAPHRKGLIHMSSILSQTLRRNLLPKSPGQTGGKGGSGGGTRTPDTRIMIPLL